MPNLRKLVLSNNHNLYRNDRAPDWSSFPALREIDVQNTGLSELPSSEQFAATPQISHVTLSHNTLKGSLSSSICSLGGLQSLSVTDNLVSDLPSCLSQLTSFHTLELFPNDSIFQIPQVVLKLSHLSFLLIIESQLSTIPSLEGMLAMESLLVYNNSLLESIDEGLFRAPLLATVDVVNAPRLSQIPHLVHGSYVRNMRFMNIGMTHWDMGDFKHFPSFSRFEITHTPLRSISGNCSNPAPFPGWREGIDTDDLNNVNAGLLGSKLTASERHHAGRSALPSDFRPAISHVGPSHVSFQNCALRDVQASVLRCFNNAETVDLSLNPLDHSTIHVVAHEVNITGTSVFSTDLSADLVEMMNVSHGSGSHKVQPTGLIYPGRRNVLNMLGTNIALEGGFVITNAAYKDPPRFGVDLSLEVDTNRSIRCYPILTGDASMRVVVHPYQFDYEHCRCVQEDMYWDGHHQTCIENPIPGLLFRYNDSVTRPLHAVKEGFYPVAPFTTAYCNTSVGLLGDCDLVQCTFLKRCNPGNQVGFQCANNFDPASLMCSKCPPGRYPLADSCLSCSSSSRWVLPVSSAIAAIALSVYIFHAHKTDYTKPFAHASVSIFLSWVQLAFVLIRLSRTMLTSESQSSSLMQTWEIVSLPLFQVITHPSIHCISDSYDFIYESWVIFIAPWVIFGLCGIAIAIVTKLSFRGSFSTSLEVPMLPSASAFANPCGGHGFTVSTIIYALFYIWNLLYMSVAQRVFEVLACDSFHGSSFLVVAPYIACSDARYLHLHAVAVVMLFVFVIGLPAIFSWLVYKNKGNVVAVESRTRSSSELFISGGTGNLRPHIVGGVSFDEDDPQQAHDEQIEVESRASSTEAQLFSTTSVWIATSRMLTAVHDPSLPYWSIGITLSRKAIVVGVVSLLPPRSALIPFLVMIVLLASLILNITWQPYYHRFDNKLETTFLALASFSFVAGFFASVNDLQNASVLYDISISINVFVACLFVVSLPWVRQRHLKGTHS